MKSESYVIALPSGRFGDRLTTRLKRARRAILATAFFTQDACEELLDPLQTALALGAKIGILLGRYDYVTEPRAVRALLEIAQHHPGRLDVRFDAEFRFHYKAATFFERHGRCAAMLGSSNLTPKGMNGLGELNLELLNHAATAKRIHAHLADRLADGLPAAAVLPDYEERYLYYAKLRTALARARGAGERRWRRRRPATPSAALGDLDRMAHCHVTEWERDPTLRDNANQRHDEVEAEEGISIPGTHLITPASFARRVKRGNTFLITDDLDRTIGLAVCTLANQVVKDSRDRNAYVTFYRYRRGGVVSFKTQTQYRRARALLRVGDKEVLKARAVATVVEVVTRLVRTRRARRAD